MKQHKQGFTLIELIVVIAILGILAAIAIPQFINQISNARKAALNGLAGAIAGANALAQAEYMAEGNSFSSTVTAITMNGMSVFVAAGCGGPLDTAGTTGIVAALSNLYGFSYAGTTGATTIGTFAFSPTITGLTNCSVQYKACTTAAPTTILVQTAGC